MSGTASHLAQRTDLPGGALRARGLGSVVHGLARGWALVGTVACLALLVAPQAQSAPGGAGQVAMSVKTAELQGKWGDVWLSMHPAQRAFITRSLFVQCKSKVKIQSSSPKAVHVVSVTGDFARTRGGGPEGAGQHGQGEDRLRRLRSVADQCRAHDTRREGLVPDRRRIEQEGIHRQELLLAEATHVSAEGRPLGRFGALFYSYRQAGGTMGAAARHLGLLALCAGVLLVLGGPARAAPPDNALQFNGSSQYMTLGTSAGTGAGGLGARSSRWRRGSRRRESASP